MSTAKPLSEVSKWLASYLSQRYPKTTVIAEPTAYQTLTKFMSKSGLYRYFPNSATFQISVDVCGVSVKESPIHAILAIVKFANHPITLNECLIFKGYAQIVHADHAFIISPKGWSPTLQRLVRDFKRLDILEYASGKFVVVAKWDNLSKSVRPGDVLLPGTL